MACGMFLTSKKHGLSGFFSLLKLSVKRPFAWAAPLSQWLMGELGHAIEIRVGALELQFCRIQA